MFGIVHPVGMCPSYMHQLQSFVAFSVLFSSKKLQKITLTAVSFFHSAAHGMLEWECLSYNEDDENNYLRSYDVSALFTRLPIDKAMGVIRTKVEDDESLSKKNPPNRQVVKIYLFSVEGPKLPASQWSSNGLTCLNMENFAQIAITWYSAEF